MEVKQIGNCMENGKRKNPNQGRVYDQSGLSPTLTDMQGGGRQPMIVDQQMCRMVGRNPDNPSDRSKGCPTEQRVEMHSQGICNTLTNVQKDNMVMETVRIKQATKEGYAECKIGGVADLLYPSSTTRRGRVQDNGDVCPTVTAMENGLHKIESQYRIRKLTANECWRIMNFSDEDFHKAEAVNSNTQLYKQAGNSIVRNVLVAIFGQMIPGKEDVYKCV